MEIVGAILAIIFIIAGFAGILVPLLPDAPLVFVGAFLYWAFNGFTGISGWLIALLFVLTLIVVIADYFAGAYGVKRLGGSGTAQALSFIGGLIGLSVGNIPGLILGTLIGAVFGELIREGDIQKSVKIGFASLLGFLGGVLFKVIMLVVMTGLFIVGALGG